MSSQTSAESVAKKPLFTSFGEMLKRSIRVITTVGALLAFWAVFSLIFFLSLMEYLS